MLALPVNEVREIVPLPLLLRPPNLPSFLEGFFQLGKQVIGVVNVCHLLGIRRQAPGLYTPLIVLWTPQPPLALLVTSVQNVHTVPAAHLAPFTPGHTFNDCAVASITLDGRLIPILATERLLLQKESQCASEFQQLAQQRLLEIESNHDASE